MGELCKDFVMIITSYDIISNSELGTDQIRITPMHSVQLNFAKETKVS